MDTNLTPYVIGSGDGEALWFFGTLATFKATAEQTGGRFALVEQVAPRGMATPLHVHREDDESFYVLEGEITVYLEDGDHPTPVPAGAFVHIPGGGRARLPGSLRDRAVARPHHPPARELHAGRRRTGAGAGPPSGGPDRHGEGRCRPRTARHRDTRAAPRCPRPTLARPYSIHPSAWKGGSPKFDCQILDRMHPRPVAARLRPLERDGAATTCSSHA
jgi:hypothetical protein